VLPSALVAAQLDALGRDLTPGAIKVGMLGSRRNVEVVAARLRRAGTPPVILDPVLRSTSGRELLDPDALGALRTELLPAALLLTPNVMEAETLLGVRIRSVADMEAAARELCRMGPSHVLIKGGHMAGEDVVDVFSDGNACRSISRARIAHEARGTGCVLSSAVAAHLALGFDLWAAWVAAADFTARAIRSGFRVGQGIVSNPGGISARLPQGSPAP
jgi:hydroxymethylpyrimidine/phosphomethylpyrimidine kinase